jgi:ABC-type sugar transport system ATPase subunit
MGNEFIVYLATAHSKIIARFDPKKMPELDTKMKVTLDMKKAHFFDKDTEIALS